MKKKLRDVTVKEYEEFYSHIEECHRMRCESCIFSKVVCSPGDPRCWINNKKFYSKEWLNQEIEIKDKKPNVRIKPTQFEKDILKNFDKIDNYQYIARDRDGSLNLYITEPVKDLYVWSSIQRIENFPFKNLFKFIQWEDDKPVLIRDFFKEEYQVYEN